MVATDKVVAQTTVEDDQGHVPSEEPPHNDLVQTAATDEAPSVAHKDLAQTADDENDHAPSVIFRHKYLAQEAVDDEKKDDSSTKPRHYQIVWKNVSYMSALHIGALYGIYLLLFKIKLWTILFTAVLYLISAYGITAGAHRLWSHKAYKAKWPLRLILMVFNCCSGQNSIYEWARDHRVHHKYSDTDADPHNSSRGFFFSHVGWLLVKKHPDVISKGQKIDLSDIKADPIVMFQKRFFLPLMLSMNVVLPTVLPSYWDESMWNAYFVCFALRYVTALNVTWCVNSVAHFFGNKPYDKSIRPVENAWVALSALGEGFHNYHHTFPWDYKTSEFGLKMNPTTAFIHIFEKIGWAYDLRSASNDVIEKRKLRTGDARQG